MSSHFVALWTELFDFHLIRMFFLISRTEVCFFSTLRTFECYKISWHLYLPPFTLNNSIIVLFLISISKQFLLKIDVEMLIGLLGGCSSPRCSVDETDLQKIRFVDIFQGDRLFTDRAGDGF